MGSAVDPMLIDEQAGLRRVATLVARGAAAEAVFSAVALEVARLLDANITKVLRFEPDGSATVVGGWSEPGLDIPIGTSLTLEGEGVAVRVKETGRPARSDRFAGPPGSVPGCFQRLGARTGVGSPIVVEGVLWGVAMAAFIRDVPLSRDSETRISRFTELVAAAIANTEARTELRGLADEQAALRRVATLVASGAAPPAVFETVAAEVGRLLPADLTLIGRYDRHGTVTGVGGWSASGDPVPAGTSIATGGRNVTTLVFDRGGSARLDSYDDASGAAADDARGRGIRSAVGAPVNVAGLLWGVMVVASTRAEPLPPRTEERLSNFTELVATAIGNTQARQELREAADQQAGLRRVATLVAQGEAPEKVFAAVAAEVGRLLPVDYALVARYVSDATATAIGAWGPAGEAVLGTTFALDTGIAATAVLETGGPVRIDDYGHLTGSTADDARARGVTASAGAPIRVEGGVWGVVIAASTREEPLPPNTEERLADFTELVAAAIANAEARAELMASRARIVTTADETRRRIERDLHDGAQQRLVSLALRLRAAQVAVPPTLAELATEIDRVAAGLTEALEELRELARGIHPAILAEGGLEPALRALARRSAVPVELEVRTDGRLPGPVEIGAYYVVSEALANAAKHASASAVTIDVQVRDGMLRVCVRDDGVGGADLTRGSGLVGLKDRVEALGGRLTLQSEPGTGTSLSVQLTLANDAAAAHRHTFDPPPPNSLRAR